MTDEIGTHEKEKLKELIQRLHTGESVEDIKEEFNTVLSGVTPHEIARIEEELIKEGIPREKIQSLCEVHLAVFKESLEHDVTVPEGHPVYILMEEHRIMLEHAEELKTLATGAGADDSSVDRIRELVHYLKESEPHYVREENVLFPYLERHGVTQPPSIMWTEHDSIREIKKEVYTAAQGTDINADQLKKVSTTLHDMLTSHFFKENKILFPTALTVIEPHEWTDIRNGFDDLGYCSFTPLKEFEGALKEEKKETHKGITFETGELSIDEIEAVLNTLPVDITFVDKEDSVKYFNQSGERIFPRTKAVIGRKVQQCHPQKSVHVVNEILESFRAGTRDAAEFWINVQGQLIYIRYFAVRGKDKKYLGCLEVTQDITDIQKIEGEKRLS
ncbi:MAG: DUF438 domain-containing protein [Candidatus Methanofastidiosia archaeon]|jgi:PAS domain S-box-containing protein